MAVSMQFMFAAALAGGLAACTPAPAPKAADPPAAATAARDLGLKQHVGSSYAAFAEGVGDGNYSLAALGLSAADRARVDAAMAVAQPAILAEGAGSEALVFTGCAATSCHEGVAVIAFDAATGSAFVAVSDRGGADVLVPNDRILGLLQVTTPNGQWQGAATRPRTAP